MLTLKNREKSANKEKKHIKAVKVSTEPIESNPFKGAAILFSCGTILVAILGLVGWFSGILAFARISETFIPMAYSTAISFLLLGSILLIHIYKPHLGKAVVFSRIIALVVSIFGLLEVAEPFVGVSLNFEDMLFPEAGMLGGFPIARMSPSTGALFFLAGIVLLLFLNLSQSKTPSKLIGDFAGIVASCIVIASLTFVIGYIYGTPLLYTGKVIPMAATTAIAFLLLGSAMLAALGLGYMPLRPIAGPTTRARLLRIFVPLTVIMVLSQGILHDIAAKHFAFSNVLFLAVLVMLSLAVVVIIVSHVARVVGGALDRAEGELKKYREHLEELVDERTAELKRANDELSQYAYAVSHDIRAPLRAIRNYADFLREDLDELIGVDQTEYLDALGEAVNEADALVTDLLELSRIDKAKDSFERIDMGTLMADLKDSIETPDNAEVVMSEVWPVIEAPVVLVRQIFTNLISNALRFNESAIRRAEVECKSVGHDHYEFFVRDNGIGIAPEYHQRIFGVFERLHTSEEYEGTGIGLAIVKKAVALLGGSIRLESRPGAGSTFYVTLPEKKKEK